MDHSGLENEAQADMERYSNSGYADMHLTLGEAGGNVTEAVRLYREHYQNRRLPYWRTFLAVDRRIRDTGAVCQRAVAGDRG